MQRVNGTNIFELTSDSENRCYTELKSYFEQMYFAN